MVSLESVLVLVVLILATLVSFQFASALIVKQAVSHAATVAARELGKGASEDDVELTLNRILAPHGIAIGSDAGFRLETPQPGLPHGDVACNPPATTDLSANEVRVTLCVSMTAGPIMNFLKPYGIDFTGKLLTASAVALRE
jgi:hypothetical protein